MSDVKDIKGFQDQIVNDCVAISKAKFFWLLDRTRK